MLVLIFLRPSILLTSIDVNITYLKKKKKKTSSLWLCISTISLLFSFSHLNLVKDVVSKFNHLTKFCYYYQPEVIVRKPRIWKMWINLKDFLAYNCLKGLIQAFFAFGQTVSNGIPCFPFHIIGAICNFYLISPFLIYCFSQLNIVVLASAFWLHRLQLFIFLLQCSVFSSMQQRSICCMVAIYGHKALH